MANTLVGTSGDDTLVGLGGNWTIDGMAGNDVLFGGNGNDIFDMDYGTISGGASGIDVMQGGLGDDTYYVDNTLDVVVENTGSGTDVVISKVDYTLFGNIEVLTLDSAGTGRVAIGNTLDNTITGNNLGDTLDGGAGADTLTGGSGNDTYVVDNTADVIWEPDAVPVSPAVDTEIDIVLSSVSFDLSDTSNPNAKLNGIENLTLTGTGNINATGNAADNILIGNIGNNTIDASDGGNDTLDGGAGADTLIGGVGQDTFFVDNAGDVIQADPGGQNTVESTISWTMGADQENLILLGSNPINGTATNAGCAITGNSATNILTGGTGDDILNGGGGADTMQGGDGNDIYFVDNSSDIVLETDPTASGGSDSIIATATYTLGANIENLTLGGNAAINGTGNSLVNVIVGNSADNTLDGQGGADTMVGGGGNDTYIVDNSSDFVDEIAGQGTDTVVAQNINYTLTTNVENLILVGSAVVGTGNSFNNVITGDTQNNTLDGSTGADTMIGADGSDTYYVDNVGDVVTEATTLGSGSADLVISSVSFTLGTGVENLTLTGTFPLTGTGNSLDNIIDATATSGIVTLDGAGGGDTLLGGTGDDTFVVYTGSESITANGLSVNTIASSTISLDLTFFSNMSNVTLLGSSNLNASGDANNNVITGNAGDNIIDGRGGTDTLEGGLGNDTFVVDSTTDTITDIGGIDTIQSSVDYDLSSSPNVENLVLTGTALLGSGDAFDNAITGNAQDNTLDGFIGVDTMSGGDGNDTYFVDNTGDLVIETNSLAAGGIDIVASSVSFTLGLNVENLSLFGATSLIGTGNSLANIIDASLTSGTVTLDGAGGADTLIGGSGNDTFVVYGDGESITVGSGVNTIASSVASIDLSLYASMQNITLLGSANLNAVGDGNDNVISGNSGDNTLDGGGGTDTLQGGLGNDTYVVDTTTDVIADVGGIDTVQSSANYDLSSVTNIENLILTGAAVSGTGDAFANVITGNGNNNILTGGGGADTLIGGTGNDTYFVDTSDTIIENSGEGTDLVVSASSYTLDSNIENLTLTGTQNMVGTGNGQANIIDASATSGTITLDGGGAPAGTPDTLIGGSGNDTFVVYDGTEVITTGSGVSTVASSMMNLDLTLYTGMQNLTLLGSSNLNATGDGNNNVITGNNGSNTIDGGGGVDTLEGGLGNDTFIVDTTTDVITDAGGMDTIQSSVNYNLGSVSNIENLILTGAALNGTGDANNNIITGNANANVLDGGGGADTLIGGDGNDTYFVHSANDVVSEISSTGGIDLVMATASYTLGANVENLALSGAATMVGTGNSLSNIIDASLTNGTVTLDGAGSGVDTLIGGSGSDTYIVYNGTEVIQNGTGTGTVASSLISLNLASYSGIQNATLLGSSSLNLVGDANNNVLTGNSGNNTLTGGAGIDSLEGGLGNDTFFVDTTTDIITDIGGTDTISSSVNYGLTLPNGIENLTLTGSAGVGTGNTLNNVITGNTTAANTLDGAGGNDTMTGGAAVDTIQGGTGDDTIDGKGGADTMYGGTGNDTFYVDNANDKIIENVGEGTDTVIVAAGVTFNAATNAPNVEFVVFQGAGAGSLTGGSGNDILTGNNGNNIINGGPGADTMTGAKGNDVYYIDNAGDVAIENDGEGTDKIILTSSISFTSFDMSISANHVENATVVGAIGFDLVGNDSDNVLVTGIGNDTLDGGAGADIMNGGRGDDIYFVNSAGDKIIDAAGNDTVIVDEHYTLQKGLENLILVDPIANETQFFGKGNSANNIIDGSLLTQDFTLQGLGGVDTLFGGSGNDTLDGGVGADKMTGGAGDDTFLVDNVGDFIVEQTNGGNDTLITRMNYVLDPAAEVENISLTGGTGQHFTGSDTDNIITSDTSSKVINGMGGNDTITGSGVADIVNGGIGDDTLIGNGGADHLTGGAGQDTFVFEFATAFKGVVGITDFNTTDTGSLGSGTPSGDVLDISDILSHATGTGQLEPLQDWVRIVNSDGNSVVQVDLDGAGTAFHYQTIAVLVNVTGLTDEVGLVISGNLNTGGFP